MAYNPKMHHRKSIRLKGYDYAQEGLYFVTICLQNRACLFGKITDGNMILNNAGKMVVNEWNALPKRFTNIRLHEYVVMPNHFHAILEIVGATLVVAQNNAPSGKTVGDMIAAFKSITTVEYIRGVKKSNWTSFDGKLWQRNYWEHIIRNDDAYQSISEYIIRNPQNWDEDKLK